MREQRSSPKPMGYEPDPHLASRQMQDLVAALNQTRTRSSRVDAPHVRYSTRLALSEMQLELRRLIQLWQASGPNLQKMFRKDPTLREQTMHGQTVFYAARNGRGYLDWSPTTPGPDATTRLLTPQEDALREFMMLITNPNWETLGGPCRRCRDYFVKKTRRERVYCSKNCGSLTTAVSSVIKHRQAKKLEQVARARQSIEKWVRSSKRKDWKKWVAMDTGLTAKWLTRAVNEGHIRVPALDRHN